MLHESVQRFLEELRRAQRARREEIRRAHGSPGGEAQPRTGERPERLLLAGSAKQPTSGRHQVWVAVSGGESFGWISAHASAEQARAVCDEINERRDRLVSPQEAEAFLTELAARSEYPLEEMPPDLEQEMHALYQGGGGALPFRPTMLVFRSYYAREKAQASQFALSALAGGPGAATASTLLSQLVLLRKLACLRAMPIKYLEPSALKMTEALLATDPRAPDLPAGESLWLHPLAPLTFHGRTVRGIALCRIFEPRAVAALLFDEQSKVFDLPGFPANDDERAIERLLAAKAQTWQVEVVVEDPDQQPPWAGRERDIGETLVLGEYDAARHRWEGNAASVRQCPTGSCRVERLGTQLSVVPCAACLQELDWWGRWLKTVFWVMEGKFRRPADTQPFETFTETVVEVAPQATSPERGAQKKGKRAGRSPARALLEHEHLVTRVAFDASYFRAARPGGRARTSRYETHLVLTTEEALAEGALEVDLEGVLIKDWSPVGGYWRTTIGKYRQYIKPKDRRGQMVSLATWKARQLARERHDLQSIFASTYRE